MTNARWLIAGAFVVCGSLPSLAGPCATAIDAMQAQVDAALEARAAAGPTARESEGALMHRQPTPGSIAAAEARLGDISPQAMEAIAASMARARRADAAGDAKACERALAEVKAAITPRGN